MSSIFPLRETVRRDEGQEPRLVDLDEETADEVFETLAATTTREIFLSLHEQPQTASDLAEMTDTSVQNAQYHLKKLQDADLVTVVDTWYSERGSEMKVFAPEDESLVLYAGRDKQSTFRSILNRMLGLASFIVPTSVLAGWVASRTVSDSGGSGGVPDGADSGTGSDDMEYETATDAGTDAPAPEREAPAPEVETVDMPEGGVEQSTGGDIGIQSTDSDLYFTGNETDGAEVIVDLNQTETPVLITDGGNATVLPDGVLNGTLTEQTASTAAETTGSVDPALLGGVAFLCGALVVLVALAAWYGVSE